MSRRWIAVIGGGPAGLMAAEVAARAGARVTIYDRMPSLARKFLLAGRGGLNLTHSEPLDRFRSRYGAAAERLGPALDAFGPDALRTWAAVLGEPTMVGSSGRVFPASWKASPLLRAWLRRLEDTGVRFRPRHRWTGFGLGGELRFETPEGPAAVAGPAATVLALGGASWPRLGADGAWVETLRQDGVAVAPLRAANCGLHVAWSDIFRDRFAGEPLKRIVLRSGTQWASGDAVVSRDGLEGGAVYPISGAVREALREAGSASLLIDLRPGLSEGDLVRRLSWPRAKQSGSTFLRKTVGLSPVATGLLREISGANLPADPALLARLIKNATLPISGTAPLERAISSAGGVAWPELDERSMLRTRPGVFLAGEMIDWEAPTGGYLLQACFATGAVAGANAAGWGETECH